MNEQRRCPSVPRCGPWSAASSPPQCCWPRRRVHLPRQHVGMRLRFADGTSAPVYRETVVDRPAPADPCVLVVEFRLRGVRGRGHAVFRWESLLNTPLFVGFPGFVSKLWLAHDAHGVYRGVYEWDGPAAAEAYARALWRVLALVSVPGSIHYRVVPGLRRSDLLADPELLDARGAGRADGLVAAGRRRVNDRPDVLVVGAGPTGLTLALQAHDHGARVRIVERRTDAFRPSRAMIVHPRTLEVLRPLGVTDDLLAHGDTAPRVRLHLGARSVPVGLAQLALTDTAFPHLTLLRQTDVEAVLARALAERGVAVEYGTELRRRCGEAADGPRASAADPVRGRRRPPARSVVGCDGAASTVRRGWASAGPAAPTGEEVVLADVELAARGAAALDPAPPTSSPAARPAVPLRPRRAGDLAAAGHPAASPGPAAGRPVRAGRTGRRTAALIDDAGLAATDHPRGLVEPGAAAAPDRRPVPARAGSSSPATRPTPTRRPADRA